MLEAQDLSALTPLPRHHEPIAITFENREEWLKLREGTIGGTDAPALFQGLIEAAEAGFAGAEENDDQDDVALSPYKTIYELWAYHSGILKKGNLSNSRIRWGQILEDPIAQGIAEERGWTIRKAPFYYRHPTVPRMGASLDYEVRFKPPGADEKDVLWLPYEIKLVEWSERWKWQAEGFWSPPPHIAVQCMHQLAVTGMPYAILGVLFGGSKEKVFVIERDDEIIADLENAVGDFWEHVDKGVPPEPDLKRDQAIIRRVYANCTRDKLVDWTDNAEAQELISRWQATQARLKEIRAEERRGKEEISEIKTRLLMLLGDAQFADLGPIMLNSSKTEATTISYERPEFRDVRLAKKKKPKAARK